MWAADYVLPDYGTGAIMAVPAHDQRDLDFARAFGLPVRIVVQTDAPDPAETGVATPGDGELVNSGPIDGLPKAEAIAAITEILAERGLGRAAVNYRLRDWLLSRQRFWGTPIPIVYCGSCGEVPVPDDQLPVVLPDLRGQDLAPKGVSPLAAADGLGEHRMPEVRRRRHAGHRHDGHVRRLLLVLPALLLARLRPAARSTSRRSAGGTRSTCTSAAASTRSCT